MSRSNVSMQILRKLVIDGFLCCSLVLCILASNLFWKPFERGFFCGDESLMYPYRGDTVTVFMLRIVGIGLPLLAFLICEWVFLRGQKAGVCFGVRIPAWLLGFYSATTSFAFGVCFVELFTNVAKHTIGRPRPHFFDICHPSVDCNSPQWQSRYIQTHEYTCTGLQTDKFGDMNKSFLSGHSSMAAFTMLYLALYLERRLVWSGTRTLRHCLQFVVVMLSWYTALSRVSDYKHHWSDVLAGYSLGICMAVVMFTWGTDLVEKEKKHLAVPQQELPHIVSNGVHTELPTL